MDPNGFPKKTFSDESISNKSLEIAKKELTLDQLSFSTKKNDNNTLYPINKKQSDKEANNIIDKSFTISNNVTPNEVKIKKDTRKIKVISNQSNYSKAVNEEENGALIAGNLKEDQEKELKLLKNRLSARKCRQKKKNYILQLEEQVKSFQKEIHQYRYEMSKEKTIEHFVSLLKDKEKEIEVEGNKDKVEDIKREFIDNQRSLLSTLFLLQIKLMMPLECKLFQNKFIKVAQFEEDDNVEVILMKINNNIKMLNELYEFKKRSNKTPLKGKERVAYKLYLFYENMKRYTEIFIANLKFID